MVSLQIAFWRLICMAFSWLREGRGGPEEGVWETIFGKSDAKLEGAYLGLLVAMVKVTNV